MDDAAAQELVARAEALVGAVENDPAAAAAIGAVLEVYGEALRRIVAAGCAPVDDELVGHLLLMHDLHPVGVEDRVAAALEEVRPYLGSHGGGVDLLAIEDGVARLRLEGACHGCPSSAVTLTHAIEAAVARAAPELRGIVAEGAA